ncbi:hypothetical protein RclHR1_27770001 [Rhizophagus clarus]|uniref:RNase H type-1 domain-containing protein n=1 Tax=Rhizophagus clarus TaxID=94130 RepID=A0A2Z6RG97_9GLOM|nr:hypothetical protein RclHR1_27770001 [Rhizophagus clarus]
MSPKTFKACLKVLRKRHLYYLSQLITPTGTHLVSWTAYRTAYIAQLTDKRGRSLSHKWYLDIQATTTIPDSHDRLYDRYVCSPTDTPAVSLVPGVTTNQKNRHWLVTLDGIAAPLFGKQLTVQPKKDTCIIVHWTSDCLSSPGDVIRLHPCLGCDAHVPFPAANKYTTVEPRCTFTVSLLRSLILPTNSERIQLNITEVVSPYSWADLCTLVVSYYTRLSISPNFSPSLPYLNSVATYAFGTICNWPSSTRAEAAAIFATLSVTPDNSVVSIYTDSQAAVDGLRSCASFTYTNSRFYYKTTNFELWASIECCIREKRLSVLPVKVKGHDGNYWNDFANSLANSAHQSDDAFPLPEAIITSSHNVRLVYDDIVCESNPRRLFKVYYQATYMRDLLLLKRFQFTFCLTDRNDYIVDWDLTWFTLNYSLSHDASFQAHHASRHYTFKFKLFLDDLPLLEKLKITRPDLYIEILTCRSCCMRKEDLMHLILCSKRRTAMHQIFQSYQNHLFSKLHEAGDLADVDPTPMIRKLSSLSCWSISSSNWSSYALIRGCLPKLFIDLFEELSIPRQSAMKVVAAIHNNFIQKLRRRIWNPRTFDKSRWEDAMHITLKLKTTPRPSNLPVSTYVPFSSLPPPTHLVTSRDSGFDWIKNSMTQGLPWYNHLSECSIHAKRLTVFSVKVKGHDSNYWNEFADSLANSAHHSDDAVLLPMAALASSHNVRLVYDDVICESNLRRLFKTYFQAAYMNDLLSLKRFQFTFCLVDRDDYVIDWDLTWFTLNYSPVHDASFQAHHASRHYTFKFKLFLDDLPLLERLKITHPDLYIDLLTCRSCCDRKEDLMHLILCSKRRAVIHQILQSYQNHLFSKLREAGELADMDPTPLLRKLSSLSCWTISSSNWSSYALIRGCLP